MVNKILERISGTVVRWISNTQAKHTEAETYLLVKSRKLPPMLFTAAQVRAAESRAEKNPEDV